MGSCASKRENQDTLSQEIEQLKADYQQLLETSRNRQREPDTSVSKEDFDAWKQEQQIKFNELEEMVEKKAAMKYSKLMVEKDTQIADLTKQVNSLKDANSTLEGKLLHISSTQTIPDQLKLRELSRAKVDEFVEKLLEDDSVNISYLPDWVERKIYKNVLNLILGLLDNTFNTTSIKLLGHLLTFNIMPDQTQNERSLELNVQEEQEDMPPLVKTESTLLNEEKELEEDIKEYVDDLVEDEKEEE